MTAVPQVRVAGADDVEAIVRVVGFAHTGETRPFPVPRFATQPCHLLVMTKRLGSGQ